MTRENGRLVAQVIGLLLLAGCGSNVPTVPSQPSASALASATPTAAGTASAADGRSTAALAAFKTFLVDSGRRFHLDLVTQMSMHGKLLDTYHFSEDVAGWDHVETMEIAGSVFHLTFIGEQEWSLVPGGTWRQTVRGQQGDEIAVRPGACLGDLDQLRVDDAASTSHLVYRYTGSTTFKPYLFSVDESTQNEVDATLVLTAAGQPVSIDCVMTAEVAAPAGARQRGEIDWTMTFSRVGEPIVVAPPVGSMSPAPARTAIPVSG